jgi:uncharacterized protein
VTRLLDANVLVALVVPDHVHHAAAEAWLAAADHPFATCPITEGALVRLLVREGAGAAAAIAVLEALARHPRHAFWPADLPYLAALARAHDGRLATFDRALAALHPDVVELVPG